ncbi:hypothetical protein [Pseudonocardia sp. T1-2H]|uniref:hypothetical protein n=1 Tax=Pseudonocardia sp. T1-2H TaxID=3128899 RepID=UPI0031013A3F
MAGYANRILHIPFPDLSEEGDTVWVSILNPSQQPPDKLRPREIPTDENGRPLDQNLAMEASYEIIAGLVVAWHVYDATAASVDYETGEALDQPLLPKVDHSHPATPELVKCLPMEIINEISRQMSQRVNPQ